MAKSKKSSPDRYSEADLKMFKKLIEDKIALAEEQVKSLEDQVLELNESLQTSGADLGDNSAYTEVEFLTTLIFRQKKHIQDLENALLRIKNKVYGICSLTGKLIDKKRLLAVPTTTKGLVAKTEAQKREAAKSNPRRLRISDRQKKKVITKTIKKKSPKKKAKISLDEFDLPDSIEDIDPEVINLDNNE